MSKIILFVILPQYADWEAAYITSAVTMLGQGQYDIKTVSTSKDFITSIGGFRVMPDYDITTAPDDYEALILIGGMTWRNADAKQVRPLVEDCQRKGKVLGGICDAVAYLAAVGALNDITHTSNDLYELKQWAADSYTGEDKYIAKQAVSDGNVITANGTAPMEFAKEILCALNVAEDKKILDWYNFHKLGYYTAPFPEM